MLKLQNIKKKYVTKSYSQVALKDISIEFRKNEFVSILGPSGSGKTTLLNIIGGLDRYDSGDLIINGKSTKKFKNSDWDAYRNNCVGFIFQNYNLINHMNIIDNVAMSMTLSGISVKKRKERALEVLDKVGLKEHAYKKPNELSGGQMQRVAIARALVNDPDIILADEPTGALDSKTSVQILELIKEISKDKLVIMVTHNSELAYSYSNRIIQVKDGEVIEDTDPITDEKENTKFKIKKTAMSFLTALKLSFNNIITKKGRTLLTAFASSIGIIGIALILSLSNGFDKQIDKFEKDTLSNLPVYASIQAINYDEEEMEAKRNKLMGSVNGNTNMPDTDYAKVININDNNKIHYNELNSEYIDYIEKIDSNLVTGITYYRGLGFNLITKNNDSVVSVSNSDVSFTSLPKELGESTYLKKGYDVLDGRFPLNNKEILIMVNDENQIDESLVKALGFTSDTVKFKELIGKTLQIVPNNDYYTNYGNFYIPNQDLNSLYDKNNNIELTIVGVIRAKSENTLAQMTTMFTSNMGMSGVSSILYDNSLALELIEINSDSKIVKEQLKQNYNVMTGEKFSNDNGKDTILSYLGYEDSPYIISIYPKDFDSKDEIITYLDKYNLDKDESKQVLYTDLAESITKTTGDIMDAITIVLISFSAISLVVSCIMIGIITYISVLERTKEIGILRSLGARSKDIKRVFNAETLIIGITSGLLGILITRLLLIPVNIILFNLTNLENVAILNPWHAIILIIVSVTLTLIGGSIPANMASKKDPVIALRTE